MSSEEQTTLVENMQLDNSCNNKDNEEMVSKYFVHKEKEKPKCSSYLEKNEDEKDMTSMRECEESSCTKDSEKRSRIDEESIEPKKIVSETEEQSVKTQEKSEEKVDISDDYENNFDCGEEKLTVEDDDCKSDQNLQNEKIAEEKEDIPNDCQKQFDIGDEKLTVDEDDCKSDRNLKNEKIAEAKEDIPNDCQKQFDIGDEKFTVEEDDSKSDQNLQNEIIADENEHAVTEVDAHVEYTSGDFRSPENESDMNIDNDDNMDTYPGSSHNEFEETKQRAVSDDDAELVDVENPEGKRRKENKKKDGRNKLRKRFSDRDTENYRNGYPGMKDDAESSDNIRFYRGEIPSSPDGALIDDIHKFWFGDYELLECHHGYIQWLFPIREHGMNWQAQPLQSHEAEAIKADPKAKRRVLESYKLMLDFYGMKLVDEETGKLERSENWKERFANLNRSSHNYLRITRILKCLGELGYEHLKKNFIQFVLEEAIEHHTLFRTLTSCRDYWIGTIKSDKDREELYNYIECHDEENSGISTPDSVWQTCSEHVRNSWVQKTFSWRILLKLAYFPLSLLWWLVSLMFRKFGMDKIG